MGKGDRRGAGKTTDIPERTYGYHAPPPKALKLGPTDIRTKSCRGKDRHKPTNPKPGQIIGERDGTGRIRIVRRVVTDENGETMVWWNRPHDLRHEHPTSLRGWRKLVAAGDWRVIGEVACGGGEPCSGDTPVEGTIVVEHNGRERVVHAVHDGVVVWFRHDCRKMFTCTVDHWRRKARRYGWKTKPLPAWAKPTQGE